MIDFYTLTHSHAIITKKGKLIYIFMLINNNFYSPNFAKREHKIQYIIIHFTEMKFDDALEKLTNNESKVSAHYLIREDGDIFQLVDDNNIAWHAGKSCWGGENGLNASSIGIELDNLGTNKFSDDQIISCLELSKFLVKKYNIPPQNFIGHSDIAPDRKIDPGIFFNWQFFAKQGLGIWHDIECSRENRDLDLTIMFQFGDSGDDIVNLQKRFAKIGYKIEITGLFDMETNYVIRAFQSKFFPEIIMEKNIDFYRDLFSIYSWDSISDMIIMSILDKAAKF